MATFNPAGPVHLMMRGPNADARIAHAKRARTLTTTTVDDVRLAARLHAEAGVPYSIARIWAFEPHPNTQDEAAIRAYAHARYDDLRRLRDAAGDADVLFQVNNEQGFRRDDFLMYTHLIERAMQDTQPVGMVFWNGATGSTQNGFWNGHGTQYVHADNAWAQDWALRFLMMLHAAREVRLPGGAFAFGLGVHNYSAYYPLIAVNAGQQRKTMRTRWNAQYANAWEAHDAFLREGMVDWRLPQDHIGREIQAIAHALGWVASAGEVFMHPAPNALVDALPRMVVTECGADALNDVLPVHLDQYVQSASAFHAEDADDSAYDVEEQPLPAHLYAQSLGLQADVLRDPFVFDAQAAGGPRGYRTLEKTWAQASWFPGQSAGYVLAYWHRWAWKVIYQPTGCVLGMNPFAEGDSGGWETFNVHGDSDYHAAMEGWQVDIPDAWLGENGEEPIMPYQEVVVELVNLGTSNSVLVRERASTKSDQVGYIKKIDGVNPTIGVLPAMKGEDIGSGRGDQWLPVRFDGPVGPVEGFAHAYFLKLPEPDPEPEGPTADEIKAGAVAIVQEAISKIQAL